MDHDYSPCPPSIVLVPPTLIASVAINEGETRNVFCGNSNASPLGIMFSWLNQSGLPPPPEVATFNRLVLNQVNRSQAGEYACVLTSRATGQAISTSLFVTVQCKWGCMVHGGDGGRRIQLWLTNQLS
jgi:hypothetical protein